MSARRVLTRDSEGPAIRLSTYEYDGTAVFAVESTGTHFSLHLSLGEVQQLAAFFNESVQLMKEGEPA